MDDSEKMARLLLELKMDAETLGKSLGKNGGDSIRNVLNRRNNLSSKLAAAIAEKHGISYKWLMTRVGEIFDSGREAGDAALLNTEQGAYVCAVCKEKERIIKLLQAQIAEQNECILSHVETIKYQKKWIDDLRGPGEPRPSPRRRIG